MARYGYAALLALACGAMSPMAQAQGQFFVMGQFGEATYQDIDADEDSADTKALSGGYRWQAGPYVQIGLEAGTGRIDELYEYTEWRSQGIGSSRTETRLETRYNHVGANARFTFGPEGRLFGIARAGYMDYRVDYSEHTSTDVIYPWPSGDSYRSLRIEDKGAYFGAGVGIDVTRYLSVNAMVNAYAFDGADVPYFGNIEVGTATTATLGVELHF